ncbi:MAG: hypothetical protein KKH28_00060 [Elusimicrobia bacterium]|nr:hypothetical protein [Elusimicrobiota bacterium]
MNKTPAHLSGLYSTPKFPLPKGQKSAGAYLRTLCLAGLARRVKAAPPQYLTQLDRELYCFARQGWEDFLLITWGLVKHLRERGVIAGPGRASAASSLVLFALGITEPDPLKHGLLFERFIYLNRRIPPELHFDLSPGGRNMAVAYLRNKYGDACVLPVAVCNTLFRQRSFALAGRALGLSRENSGRNIITTIPEEAIARHGIARLNLFERELLEVLNRTERAIKEKKDQTFSLKKIPLDDKKTFAMLANGKTDGLSQFKSVLMREYLKMLKPETINDLAAIISLYRPGPIASGLLDVFIDARHGQSSVKSPHPLVEKQLAETYGILVYQEQVMQIAKTLAGFTPEMANELRREMGKRGDGVKDFRLKFIAGCSRNGMAAAEASAIFAYIADYAGYGFNKAHALCCALTEYRAAYLKANYGAYYAKLAARQ